MRTLVMTNGELRERIALVEDELRRARALCVALEAIIAGDRELLWRALEPFDSRADQETYGFRVAQWLNDSLAINSGGAS